MEVRPHRIINRKITKEIKVGNVKVGGNAPISVQSMTNTLTTDIKGTINQIHSLEDAGADIVRVSCPDEDSTKALKEIIKHVDVPIVADIHFTPNAAEVAARIAEKVRINPGNYADRKKFESLEYSNESYESELERIREKFVPLVQICKEHGTAMRIGTNHGSLSDRILSRYGDTPLGMVESAMEFLRIAESENYHQIILSMKASNTQVMVQAYRLLVKSMVEEGMIYPLHLGVTEAGEAEDGRIKSAVGIGTLLEDGLGDTIRVSLTEEPEAEIPVAQSLVDRYTHRKAEPIIPPINVLPYNPFFRERRVSNEIIGCGGEEVPRVVGHCLKEKISHQDLNVFGYLYSETLDKWHVSDQAVDFLYIGGNKINFEIPGTLSIIQDLEALEEKVRHYPLANYNQLSNLESDSISFISVPTDCSIEILEQIKESQNSILIMETSNSHGFADQRRFFIQCMEQNMKNPIIVKRAYDQGTKDDLLLFASTDLGGLQLDGFGDGIWIDGHFSSGFLTETAFGILQASRSRISKTEYISCPSCGRTLFDLQETTAKIRDRTSHLKGIKIGIMGCIVNGPGEMADADYGYVGTGTDKISLYKGQEVVQRNVPTHKAVDALIQLIDTHGDWIEPVDV